jgi:hypothetical protein
MLHKLPLLEPPVEINDIQLRKEKFQLPGLDHILDLCAKRQDFPHHIMNKKRRRSLVKEFLCPDPLDEPLSKRPRAFSMDDKNGYKVFSWFQDKPSSLLGKRRHSMFESRDLMRMDLKKGAIRPWTVEEDGKLLAAVKTYGSDWTKVCEQLPDRNRRQCKEHWYRVLAKRPCATGIDPERISFDPNAPKAVEIDATLDIIEAESSRRGLWSEDEDKKLLNAYQELGPRWPLIAARVPGRNQRQCEKRYRRIKKSQDDSIDETQSVGSIVTLSTLADLASQNNMIPCQ